MSISPLIQSGRFTPTRVGTTSEKLPLTSQDGSPPRAWGRLRVLRDPIDRAVHPHARGDDANHERNALQDGSPPRAWGRH